MKQLIFPKKKLGCGGAGAPSKCVGLRPCSYLFEFSTRMITFVANYFSWLVMCCVVDNEIYVVSIEVFVRQGRGELCCVSAKKNEICNLVH